MSRPSGEHRDAGSVRRPLRADARRNREAILVAAANVFAQLGASGSTEAIAREAGIAVGTVFRHFPTKTDLLRAIMKDLLEKLTVEAEGLARADAAGGLFRFFRLVVEEAAAKRVVVELLADAGLNASGAWAALEGAVTRLLHQGQRANTVRRDVATDQVMAILVAVTQGVLQGGWDDSLRTRTLAVMLDGLKPGISG